MCGLCQRKRRRPHVVSLKGVVEPKPNESSQKHRRCYVNPPFSRELLPAKARYATPFLSSLSLLEKQDIVKNPEL